MIVKLAQKTTPLLYQKRKMLYLHNVTGFSKGTVILCIAVCQCSENVNDVKVLWN